MDKDDRKGATQKPSSSKRRSRSPLRRQPPPPATSSTVTPSAVLPPLPPSPPPQPQVYENFPPPPGMSLAGRVQCPLCLLTFVSVRYYDRHILTHNPVLGAENVEEAWKAVVDTHSSNPPAHLVELVQPHLPPEAAVATPLPLPPSADSDEAPADPAKDQVLHPNVPAGDGDGGQE